MKSLPVLILLLLLYNTLTAQQNDKIVRIARIEVDASQLEKYKAALQEGIETSIRLELGVLTLYAVAEKNRPTSITVLEVYANAEAYQSHIQTEHFKKYKNATGNMIKSLELIETTPIALGAKS
ncbi:MAG: antibiotic biosynthesis monooxygenase [Sphingobacteriia bacterium]|nr:antibiotic biosynthesis monooxygenase [Sphingobacteriia bacterium]